MAEFVFTSPGVKFRERDISFVTRNVGITTLGLVGETQKGPAFEPVFVQDKGEFRTRFGSQSNEKFPNGQLRYQTPYVANAYLNESSQLWVTRVLGLSGYNAGTAWAITLNAGVDLSTTGVTSSTPTANIGFTNNSYLGQTILQTGDAGSFFSGFTKSGNIFSGVRIDFTANTVTNGSGSVNQIATTITGSSYSEYENMVLAVIRSRATVTDIDSAAPNTRFEADTLTISGNDTNTGIGDLFANIELEAFKAGDATDPVSSTETYSVSLNPNSTSFIGSVLGRTPKGKNNKIWCESVYPDLIKKIDAEGLGYGINTDIIDATSDGFTNYKEQFKTPETPWIVSELKGDDVDRLFKFISISDGDSANKEIKISITDIDPISKQFSVIIRDFNDTDNNVSVLESFTRCTMKKGENNFIGSRIGTSNGDYPLQSQFVMLELNENASETSFPAGFEGYDVKDWSASATTSSNVGVAPKIMYKKSYASDERLSNFFLGISETAYSTNNITGVGINQNLFNYIGQSVFSKTKGFHMDSGATGTYFDGVTSLGQFEVGGGRFRTSADVQDGDVYGDARSRKFTLVPAGGFDGWDVHRIERSNGDLFRKGGIYDGVEDGITPNNDFQAWETSINTFANPEEVTINLFAVPSINWSDNLVLVKNTIEMIETERTDALYIIDAPDIDIAVSVGERADFVVANDIVDLLDSTDIDSSYATTYYPWIQIADTENNVNVWLPPTGEVVKSMAYTDNISYPWFAPAGLQRGVTDARKSKYRMSESSRNILYNGRINPMVDFSDVGTAIFGQKTLQVRESALDRINVRRLLLQIKVLISNIANRLLFEQNDQATIDEFLSKTNPLLDSIRRERGLSEFSIKMDDSNNSPETRDRNELYGEIYLKPTKAVEFIGITFTITPEGASFDDI